MLAQQALWMLLSTFFIKGRISPLYCRQRKTSSATMVIVFFVVGSAS